MFIGLRLELIDDPESADSIAVAVLYPTEQPSKPTAFGPYVLDVGVDAPASPGRHPLVVVSHGNGGSRWLYRTVCMHLAQQGYVVAMLDHPGNNRNDNALENTEQNLINRPRHVCLTIEALLSDPSWAPSLNQDKVALIGHSIGGYTALAVAGARVWSPYSGGPVQVMSDPRVKALVLFAPATPWLAVDGALNQVNQPILMYTAEHDDVAPPWHAELVLNGVPDRQQVTHRVVKNAGHFSFLSPFPAAMVKPDFPPSMDPEGFDRAQFHASLQQEVLQYLDQVLLIGS